MDNFYGWDYEDNMIFYHGQWRPNRQVTLLRFWEYISCPFDDEKQKHGRQLKIIGFWVNIEDGSISLSPSSVTDILEKINQFISTPNWKPLLRDWQRLAGHLNWLFNVLPHPSRGVFINAKVKSNLTWLASIIPRSIGVRFIDSGQWPDSGADLIVWTDASLCLALSFVYGNNGFLYQLRESPPNIKIDIFFLGLVAIMSVIHHVALFASPPKQLLIFTTALTLWPSLILFVPTKPSIMVLYWESPQSSYALELTFEYVISKENRTFGQTYCLDFCLRNSPQSSLHTASAYLILLVISCRCDGGSAFELIGRG